MIVKVACLHVNTAQHLQVLVMAIREARRYRGRFSYFDIALQVGGKPRYIHQFIRSPTIVRPGCSCFLSKKVRTARHVLNACPTKNRAALCNRDITKAMTSLDSLSLLVLTLLILFASTLRTFLGVGGRNRVTFVAHGSRHGFALWRARALVFRVKIIRLSV